MTLELTGWDAYADQAGRIYSDLRLRRIAQLIGGQLRTSDVLARKHIARPKLTSDQLRNASEAQVGVDTPRLVGVGVPASEFEGHQT